MGQCTKRRQGEAGRLGRLAVLKSSVVAQQLGTDDVPVLAAQRGKGVVRLMLEVLVGPV